MGGRGEGTQQQTEAGAMGGVVQVTLCVVLLSLPP